MAGLFENLPYVDFHRLNIDWVLHKIKELTAEWETLSHDVSELDGSFQSLQQYVTNYFSNLDLTQEVSDKLDTMASDGDLAAVIAPLINQFYYNVKDFGAKGDGVTDDSDAIQAAIDAAAAAGGGIVGIPSSSDPFIYSRIMVKDNVTLQGFGGILKLRDNVCIDNTVAYYTLSNLGCNNGRFVNLIIDQNNATNTSFEVADAITCVGANSAVIGCTIYNVVDSGIMFSQVTNGVCIGNRIDGGPDCGIYINDGAGGNAYNNIVAFNRITNFTATGIACKRTLTRHIVIGNVIEASNYGITFEKAGGGSDSYDDNISFNLLRDIDTTSIRLDNSPHVIIEGNRLENFGSSGILLRGDSHHCVVHGNIITREDAFTVTGTNRSGIMLLGFSNVGPYKNVVTGNVLDYTTSGFNSIWLIKIPAFTSGGDHNIVRDNICEALLRVDADFEYNDIGGNICSATPNSIYILGANNNLYNNSVAGSIIGNVDASIPTIYCKIGTRRISYGSAAPTTGTWEVGDIVLASNPSTYLCWVCTAAGTPGTWRAV